MKSLWSDTCKMRAFESLRGNKKTDVLIIGGGICGILCAYFLKEKGIDSILVEKGRLCEGTTANTTGKITFQHGLIYTRLIKSLGEERAKMYLEANKSALDKYKELFAEYNCDYQIKDSYVYSLTDSKKLVDETEALTRLGYYADICKPTELPFKTAGAVHFKNQMQFHPLRFLNEITNGLTIYENTFVKDVKGNVAELESGSINAELIVFATHFPFKDNHGCYPLKLYQSRSYVIAVDNAADINGIYIDENEKGLSFRNYENLLLIGGGAHRTGKSGCVWNELRAFKARYYPAAKEVYHWAAQDCMSLDGSCYIGRYSASKSSWLVATGFNKWGMTGSMVAAQLISDIICGIENEYAPAFNPSRSILQPQLAVNGFETAVNLLTPFPKRCTHLGCALKWNKAEHSWDCACHGSRFSENGDVLNNPANKNL